MTRNRTIAGVGLLALVLVGVYLWLAPRDVGMRPPDPVAAGISSPDASPSSAAPAVARLDAAAPAAPRRRPSEAEREAARVVHEAIRQARERARHAPTPAPGATGATASANAPGEATALDRDYVRAAMREVLPLLSECYMLALAEQPGLAGELVADFTIEGEPEVGGVIADVTIAPESGLDNATMNECVRETVYTLQLPAPQAGGTLSVRYPVRFAASEEEADEAERAQTGPASAGGAP